MHTKYSLFSSFFPLLFIFENLFVLFTSCVAHPTKKLHMEKVFGNGNIYHKRCKLMPSNLICPYETFLHEYYHMHLVMNNFIFLIFTFKRFMNQKIKELNKTKLILYLSMHLHSAYFVNKCYSHRNEIYFSGKLN